jgi:hypothetical protein
MALRRVVFPAGTLVQPGIQVGSSTSGLAQLASNTLSVLDLYNFPPSAENFEAIHFLDNAGIVIGDSAPQNRLPNKSSVELNYENPAAASGLAFTYGEWNPDTPDTKPVVFFRSRGASQGSSGAVLAGDVLGRLEWQGDLGDGTPNVIAAAIYARVALGSTPGTGNSRALAGDLVFQTAPGDGVTDPQDRLIITGSGNWNLVTGSVKMGAVNTVLAPGGVFNSANYRVARATIADDAVFSFAIPTNASIVFLSESTAGTSAPCGLFAARTDVAAAPEALAPLIGAANVTFSTTAYTNGTSDGVDGNLNIGSPGDGSVYVKNRLGASQNYAFTLLPS